MNDLQAHVIKKRIVEPVKKQYGGSSAEVESAKRVAESTRRIATSSPSAPLPPETLANLEAAARTYLDIDGESSGFFDLYPDGRPLPEWFVISKCLQR